MGAQNAKLESPVGNLTYDETIQLRRTFLEITKTDGTEKHITCSYSNFQSHCENYLDDWLAKKIADRLSVKGKGVEVVINLQDFLMFGSSIFKGSSEEKFHTIWTILVEDKSNNDLEISFQADEIHKYTRSIIESYMKCSQYSPSGHLAKSWENAVPMSSDSVNDLALYLLKDLFHTNVDEKKLINVNVEDPKSLKEPDGTRKKFSMEEVIKSLSQNILFLNIHTSVLSECFGFDKSVYFARDLIPYCLRVPSATTAFTPVDFTVLDLSRVIFLNSHLPCESRKKWRYLFSSAQHGESFAKLLGLLVDKGPTLIIIKDNHGRIFGAYGSHNWSPSPKFYGEEQCFLFHLSPRFLTYSTTGYNKNYQYLNIQQKTLPNGLGFGGTLEYFAIWIDAEYGKGKCSPTCTTFNSPQMSTSQEFTIDHLEVWGIGEEPKKLEGERVNASSILDKDPEAKAIMELMGRHAVSDGYRDIPKDNIEPMSTD